MFEPGGDLIQYFYNHANEAWRVHKFIKNYKMKLGALWATFRKQLGFNIAESIYPEILVLVVLRHLVALGCHFGARWILTGGQLFLVLRQST